MVTKIRRFRGRIHSNFNNKFKKEHEEYFEKLNELNKMRNELVYEHRKLYHESHSKQFNEFNRIHRYLRWMSQQDF